MGWLYDLVRHIILRVTFFQKKKNLAVKTEAWQARFVYNHN